MVVFWYCDLRWPDVIEKTLGRVSKWHRNNVFLRPSSDYQHDVEPTLAQLSDASWVLLFTETTLLMER
jgi:hypothetical protein